MSRFCFFLLPRALALPLLLAGAALSAQVIPEAPLSETLDTSREPLPAVASGLQAESDGASVALTWRPFEGQEGGTVILRHAAPITASNYTQAEAIAELEAAAASFVDFPQEGGSFYYAVASRDAASGDIQPFFVPSENATVFPVEIAVSKPDAEVRVRFLDVILKNQAIVVSWETDPIGSSVVIYRSTRPFDGITALAQASIVAAGNEASPPYVDYPVPGVPYYYAVVPESVLRRGAVSFSYGENTNEIPVEVPGEYARIPSRARSSVRDIPLPRLNPMRAAQTSPAVFSEQTEAIVASLSASARQSLNERKSPVERDAPYRFPEDEGNGGGGEEAALKSILDSNFDEGNWAGLEADLNRFLSLRRTDEVAGRARFYLGEAFYFMGDFSRALEEFLLMRDVYPAKAAEWIQKTLKRLLKA